MSHAGIRRGGVGAREGGREGVGGRRGGGGRKEGVEVGM